MVTKTKKICNPKKTIAFRKTKEYIGIVQNAKERRNRMTLKAMRVNKNLSRREVAEKLGVTVECYRRKETNKSGLKLSEGFVLADLFGVSINEIKEAVES